MNMTDLRMVPDDESVDYAALLRMLRRGWWIIALCATIAVLLAVYSLHNATYRYTSTMVITPAQYSRSDGLSSKLGQLGGLASAVGVSLPDGNSTSEFKLYIEGLRSYDIAQILAADRKFMQQLFEREWDPVLKRWRTPQGTLRDIITSLKGLLGIPNLPYQPPNATRLQTLLADQLIVDVNPRSPVITVSFEHADPAFANAILQRIDSATDGLLRRRALLRTDDYIAYLTARLPSVVMPEQKQSVAQTLSEQERLKMVQSSTRPYAAEIFSGPSASFRPTSPKPYKLLLLSCLGGVGIGIALAILRGRRRARQDLAE